MGTMYPLDSRTTSPDDATIALGPGVLPAVAFESASLVGDESRAYVWYPRTAVVPPRIRHRTQGSQECVLRRPAICPGNRNDWTRSLRDNGLAAGLRFAAEVSDPT